MWEIVKSLEAFLLENPNALFIIHGELFHFSSPANGWYYGWDSIKERAAMIIEIEPQRYNEITCSSIIKSASVCKKIHVFLSVPFCLDHVILASVDVISARLDERRITFEGW